MADVGDVFKALADPTRRRILDGLAERDDQTLFEICARLATQHQISSSRQAISQHLELLEEAGLVRTRREGRYKFHTLDTAPLEQIAQRWLRKPQENRLRPGQQLPQERRHLPELRLLHLRRGPHECSACLHAPDR